MGTEDRSTGFVRFLRIVALIDLGVLAIVGLVYWFAGWQAPEKYGNGLIWAGGIAIALGVASQLGGWGLTRSPDVLLAQSAGMDGISARTGRTARDLLRAYDFLFTMVAAGIVAVGIGELIRLIWA